MPRSRDYDLVDIAGGAQALRRRAARPGHPPGGAGRRHRRQPREPGQVLLRQPDDGRAAHRGGAPGRRRASWSPPAPSAPTRSSRRCRSARTTSGTAIPRRPTRPTAWPRRCCSCSRRPTASSTASTASCCSRSTSTARATTSISQTSHVIPAMIRKCVDARAATAQPRSSLWGDGSPTREFLYVEDAAEGIVLAAERYDSQRAGEPRQRRARSPSATWPTLIARLTGYRRAASSGTPASPTASRAAARRRRAPASASASTRADLVRRGAARAPIDLVREQHRTRRSSTRMKRALITGITGQDGSYLAELLLAKGYEVYGIVRRSVSFNTERIDDIYQDPHEPDYRLRLHLRRSRRRHRRSTASCAPSSPTRSTTSARRATCASASTSPSTPPRSTGLGHAAPARGDARDAASQPRFYQASSTRAVRQRRRAPQTRDDAVPSAHRPTPCAKVYALLDHRELPRGVRHVRLQRDPLQPRVARAAARPS